MAHKWLTAAERAQLTSWPAKIARSDLAAYFTLPVADVRWLRGLRAGDEVRLALAVQLCGLTYFGWIPTDLGATPPAVTARLAARLGVPAAVLDLYRAG